MAKVQQNANLHEKTVKKVAENAIAAYPTKRARGKAKRPRNTTVQVRIWSDGVNEMIVDYVLRNKIDYRLIEIVSEDEIIIHNNPED